MSDILDQAREAIMEKHGHHQQAVAGFSIKKIKPIGDGKYEVTYTEGVDAPFNDLFAEWDGKRDRTPRKRLVFTAK